MFYTCIKTGPYAQGEPMWVLWTPCRSYVDLINLVFLHCNKQVSIPWIIRWNVIVAVSFFCMPHVATCHLRNILFRIRMPLDLHPSLSSDHVWCECRARASTSPCDTPNSCSAASLLMKTPRHEIVLCITGPLCGESIVHQWSPLTCFFLLLLLLLVHEDSRLAVGLRHHDAHATSLYGNCLRQEILSL